MTQFYIFHDEDYLKRVEDFSTKNWFDLLTKSSTISQEKCYFDENYPYEAEGFYVATAENNKVCLECILNKDPQILNIINFITAGNNYDAKLNKLKIGLEQLRKQIAISDPNARKCPICNAKQAYKVSFDGYYNFKCNNCQIGYIGSQKFYYNGATYTMAEAKKIYKMKAFK